MTSDSDRDEASTTTLEWDGVTLRSTLNNWVLEARDRIADAARDGRWQDLLDLLGEHPSFVNSCRPGGVSRFTPLHQAAYLRAPVPIIEHLIDRGAWRTARNAKGERPVDTARRRGAAAQLVALLEPVLESPASSDRLAAVQAHFHELIQRRAATQVGEHQLRLPSLEPLTKMKTGQHVWFCVPGMLGGFSFWLVQGGAEPQVVVESWSRIESGSGERHRITRSGFELIEAGFV
jgi:hypothetical protein